MSLWKTKTTAAVGSSCVSHVMERGRRQRIAVDVRLDCFIPSVFREEVSQFVNTEGLVLDDRGTEDVLVGDD